MKTIEVHINGCVSRWSGGHFIAVWNESRANEPVPDHMIDIPVVFNRSKLDRSAIEQIVLAHSFEDGVAVKVSRFDTLRLMSWLVSSMPHPLTTDTDMSREPRSGLVFRPTDDGGMTITVVAR